MDNCRMKNIAKFGLLIKRPVTTVIGIMQTVEASNAEAFVK